MEVQIINDTIQKFNNESFYKCGYYFQHKGKRLHRSVWEYHNGKITNGYHVHHKDENRSNNQIDNLRLIDGREHLSGHMSQPDRVAYSKESIKNAIVAASEWHHSAEGRKWHSKHAKEYWANAQYNTYTCDFCCADYKSKVVRHKGHHFCSSNCKASFRRRRIKNES